jgi:exopolysaccharide biosynthesis WecB/TagA/CpsF family protein
LAASSVRLLGLDFDDLTLEQVLGRLLRRPADRHFSYIVTPNADHLARLRRIPRLRPIYRGAMLCLLDSQFVARCADALRIERPRVVTGADLAAALLDTLAVTRPGCRVAVVGMTSAAFNQLARRYKSLCLLHHAPSMGLLHNVGAFKIARDFICTADAEFTFLALGSPVQEILAHAAAGQPASSGIGLCVGSALAYCAGTEPRAPLWMRARGLEWMHRLLRHPARLAQRYLADDPRVLAALAIEALRQQRQRVR